MQLLYHLLMDKISKLFSLFFFWHSFDNTLYLLSIYLFFLLKIVNKKIANKKNINNKNIDNKKIANKNIYLIYIFLSI